MLYRDVMNFYLGQYPENALIMAVGQNTPIGDWILQYQETDWKFTRRLASHFSSFVLPNTKTRGVKCCFGDATAV